MPAMSPTPMTELIVPFVIDETSIMMQNAMGTATRANTAAMSSIDAEIVPAASPVFVAILRKGFVCRCPWRKQCVIGPESADTIRHTT